MNRAAPAPGRQPARKICILGMHRSGTSCLAGSLEQAGVFLGDVNKRATYNKKGNRENVALQRLNEDLLNLNDGSWDVLPAKLDWTAEMRSRRDALLAEYDANPIWGFKDPRCLVTLPFWREALPDMRYVATFRHPVPVVRSLSQRPELLPRTPPLKLWLEYNARLLAVCRAEPVPLVCFDWPKAAYLEALKIVNQEIGLQSTHAESPFFDARLITAGAERAAHGPEIGPAEMLNEAMRLYEELHEAAIDVSTDSRSEAPLAPAPVTTR